MHYMYMVCTGRSHKGWSPCLHIPGHTYVYIYIYTYVGGDSTNAIQLGAIRGGPYACVYIHIYIYDMLVEHICCTVRSHKEGGPNQWFGDPEDRPLCTYTYVYMHMCMHVCIYI